MVNGAEVPETTVHELPDPLPDEVAVLDVREPDEWAAGHVPGSMHIPLADLPGRVDIMPAGRVLVVCRSGARSARATAFLNRRGSEATNLGGGLQAWAQAGRPMVSDSGSDPKVR